MPDRPVIFNNKIDQKEFLDQENSKDKRKKAE